MKWVGHGFAYPWFSGEPDVLAGTRSRSAEPRDEDARSSILLEAAGTGIQDGEDMTLGKGGRSGRSLAAEGATAHACAAIPHYTPPRRHLLTPTDTGRTRHSSEYRVSWQGVSRRFSQISDRPAPMDRQQFTGLIWGAWTATLDATRLRMAQFGVRRLLSRRAMGVYGSRWASQSSKLLHGRLRVRGWVRLPYASAPECISTSRKRQALARHR